jgi:hypothetical protein
MHDRIVTVAPGIEIGGIKVEELRLVGEILHLDVVQFCRSIIAAAREWSTGRADDQFVQRNLPLLVRYRPDGLPPFSVGIPVIA